VGVDYHLKSNFKVSATDGQSVSLGEEPLLGLFTRTYNVACMTIASCALSEVGRVLSWVQCLGLR